MTLVRAGPTGRKKRAPESWIAIQLSGVFYVLINCQAKPSQAKPSQAKPSQAKPGSGFSPTALGLPSTALSRGQTAGFCRSAYRWNSTRLKPAPGSSHSVRFAKPGLRPTGRLATVGG
ncbi:MAG TPA: hypothetical protein DEO64_04685 [Alcaligenes faecalis]|nr:hypothetical protein [Alcaligenes faecalis]